MRLNELGMCFVKAEFSVAVGLKLYSVIAITNNILIL